MKKISIGGLILGLIATALTLGFIFGLKTILFEEFLPAMAGSSMTPADYEMIVTVFAALEKIFIVLGIINAICAIFSGFKFANVILTILGIFELLMIITLIPAIFNLIAAGVGRKHNKKING